MFLSFSSYLFAFGCTGLYCCPRAFSSCSQHRGGCFCCGAQTLELGPHDRGHRLCCPVACGTFLNRVWRPCPLRLAMWLSHWTTRTVPTLCFSDGYSGQGVFGLDRHPQGHARTHALIHTPHGQGQPSFWTFNVTELLGPDRGQKLKSLPCRCPRLDESPN